METAESNVVAVLAEKPSVARDIARVLGASKQGEGYLQGNGYVVTWAIGHLVALAQPGEMNPAWRRWSGDSLPMLPERWPLVVYEKTREQFEVVHKILNSRRVSRVICATDAGREGELIFRYIYEAADCEKPIQRLWISSLTPEAIRKGFETLRPGSEYVPLADAACGRSRADWLVGMNLSRAYSIACNEELSVGRVQTPTLAMMVERELAIRKFVPESYIEVVATFHPDGQAPDSTYRGTWFRPLLENDRGKDEQTPGTRLDADGIEADVIVERARMGTARIESLESANQRTLPPLLYDLTELQRHANRIFGFSAQKTLDLAQALYERHKLISYPRTDSHHLSQDVAKTLSRVVGTIEGRYRKDLAPGTGERSLGRRFVDDAKVSDHHAIIPTTGVPPKSGLSGDEEKIYDLICRRLLSAWHDDYIVAVTTVITAISNGEVVDRYRTSGSAVQQVGWKALDYGVERKKSGRASADADAPEETVPSGLALGQVQDVQDVRALSRKTRAPKRYTEATLLTAMETAGKTLDEKELSEAMKASGLGTPATRASIIEVLLKREYIERNGKNLEATEKGIRLIRVVHPEVKSPAMTGQWEAYLQRIQRGTAQLQPFLNGIEDYVREVVGKVEGAPRAERIAEASGPQRNDAIKATLSGKSLAEILESGFGFDSFRPNQEAVCTAAVEGRDVLLVMPTGSGKSLCYQLPGIARGGTTLVISPLVALMEDQVAKLKERGFAVECIHSGRDRATSRQACVAYLAGRLQFLFIAPERMRVAGFPEMLAKRKPSLIAIDEAHCISQWGHDFRPDYRMLGQYLPLLRPAPVIALTATATPLVQKDICEQLKLQDAAQFVHGFRRDNIAIEVVEAAPPERLSRIAEVLADPARRPAIVYTPTRKQAEEVAGELMRTFAASAYHAGLDAEHRRKVQQEFLADKIEVMIATIAFGMGIDKPNVRTVIHTALPGSLEGYYQEIGRAGRDGLPSRALLMQSYADRHTHDFFLQRDYPDVTVLDHMFAALTEQPVKKTHLQKHLKIDPDLFDKALEKLWTHGGAGVDHEENITRGEDRWRSAYLLQARQRSAQIELVIRFSSSNACRMSTLVRHFGDVADTKIACGLCDFCTPGACIAQRYRTATEEERATLFRVLAALRSRGSQSTGKLYSGLLPAAEMSRDSFENILGAMARAGLLLQADETFETDGKRIPYRTVRLTQQGQHVDERSHISFVMKDTSRAARKTARRKKTKNAKHPTRTTRATTEGKPTRKRTDKADMAVETSGLEEALRRWRLHEARRRSVPAFRIFNDQVLRSIVSDRPRSSNQLLAISGFGSNLVKQYGNQICNLVKQHASG